MTASLAKEAPVVATTGGIGVAGTHVVHSGIALGTVVGVVSRTPAVVTDVGAVREQPLELQLLRSRENRSAPNPAAHAIDAPLPHHLDHAARLVIVPVRRRFLREYGSPAGDRRHAAPVPPRCAANRVVKFLVVPT